MPPIRVIPPPPGPASFQGLQAWYKTDSFAATHREPGSISGLRAHYKADGLVASSPDTLSGLHAWYKADSITGLADAAAISQWDDSSGNGRHATQATAGNRPLYKTNILNGGPVVRFDGTSDFMSATMTVPQPFTMFAVVKHDDTAGSFQVFLDGDGSGGLFTQLFRNSSNAHAIFASGGGIIAQADSNTNWNIHVGAFHTNGGSIRNGVHVVGTPGTGALTNLTIGAQGPGSLRFLNGDIAEIIIFSRTLTTTEREQVERYLSAKYSINTAISAWTDVAGGFTASQATNANKPTYVPSVAGFNNKPVVRFDGSNDHLANTSISVAQPSTIVAVAKYTDTAASIQFIVDGANAAGNRQALFRDAANTVNIFAGTGVVGPASDANLNIWVVNFNGASSVRTKNGENSGLLNPNTQTLDGIRLGATQALTAGQFLNGDLAEVIVYDRTLTAAEQEGLELYLANKYGITSMAVGAGWTDHKSGISLVQATGADKPSLVQNAQNGKPTIRGNATTRKVLSAASALTARATQTIFIAGHKLSAVDATHRALFQFANGAGIYTNSVAHATDWAWNVNQAAAGDPIGVPAQGFKIIVLTSTGASNLVVRSNGGAAADTIDPADALTTGTALNIGFDSQSGVSASDYEVGEILIYNQVLSLTAINVIGRYLAQKWGTTWTTAT